MVKHFLTLIFVIRVTALQAQDYKPVKVNMSAGIAIPSGTGLSAGLLLGIEPRYAIRPRWDLGLRLESAIMVRGVTWDGNGSASSGTASRINSALLTATHFFGPFGEANTRLFVGVGAGVYAMSSAGTVVIDQTKTTVDLPMTSYNTLGGLLRGGIKVGHFVGSVEFNAIPAHVYPLANTNAEFTSKSAYTGIRLGFDIGGGRK